MKHRLICYPIIFGLWFFVAAGADFLAADLPLVLHLGGKTHYFPNITQPASLKPYTIADLQLLMGKGDWMVIPPIPWGPNTQDKSLTPFGGLSKAHPLGCDGSRRDVISRLIHGSRTALALGFGSVLLYGLVGICLGFAGAFWGGWIDQLISRVTEGVLAIPVFFVVLALMGILESPGLGTLILLMGAFYWAPIARLTRMEVLKLRKAPFIDAAISMGCPTHRLLLHHFLPNIAAPLLVSAAFGVAGCIVMESGLSFLGFGLPEDQASWGSLLKAASHNVHAWWLAIFPGLVLFGVVVACHQWADLIQIRLSGHRREQRKPPLFQGAGRVLPFFRGE